MRIFTIDSGFFSTDGGAMFGVMSRKIWAGKYPVDDENRCPLAMRCLFADFGSHRVLFDTGVGLKPTGMSYYRFHDLLDIVDELARHGYRAEDVTDVVLSHLHFDHCGGCTEFNGEGKVVMTFPNARHWTTKGQWENSQHPKFWEADAYLTENMQAVFEAGKLEILDENGENMPKDVRLLPDGRFELFPGLSVGIYQGHTYDQLVSFLETEQGNFIYSGDVVPMCLHVTQGCIAAIDNHAAESVEEKMRLLRLAHSQHSRLYFYHDACTVSASLKEMNGHISAVDREVSNYHHLDISRR